MEKTDLDTIAPVTPQALATVDTVAALWLARAAPVRFSIASSAAEREATYRLRYRAIVERGWKQPEELPGGIERDEWDDSALHVAAWDGEVAVGSFRLIFPEPGRPLPVEAAFGVVIAPAGQAVELGRITVAREASETQHHIFMGLLGSSWQHIRMRGYVYLTSDMNAAMLRLYGSLGLRLIRQGPPRPYWGERRFPGLCDIPGSAATLARKWLGDSD